MGLKKDEEADYVVIDYKADRYDEYDCLEDTEEAIQDLVSDYGITETRRKLEDYDILVVKGTVVEVELENKISVKVS